MNKKGQEISMTYIVVAAIALVVLIVAILFFTGGLQAIFKAQKETVAGATDQQLEIWRGQCKLYCSLEQKESWEKHEFKAGDEVLYTGCGHKDLMDTTWEECEEGTKETEPKGTEVEITK